MLFLSTSQVIVDCVASTMRCIYIGVFKQFSYEFVSLPAYVTRGVLLDVEIFLVGFIFIVILCTNLMDNI